MKTKKKLFPLTLLHCCTFSRTTLVSSVDFSKKKKKKKKNPLLPTKFFESLIIRFRKVGWALTLFSALEPRLDRNWKFFQLFITLHSRTGCFIWIEKTKESGNSSYYSMFNLIVLTCKSKLVSEVIYFIWKIKTFPLPSKKVN